MLAFFRDHRAVAVLIVVLSLPLVLAPRFNRQDLGIVQPLIGTPKGEVQIDMRNYLNLTRYFRGELSLDSVAAPFAYRPLVPFLAARLPFDPFLSFNLVNVAAIGITPLIVFLTVRRLGFPFEYGILGGLLYLWSFPVMYYGPSGYVDATAMLILFLMVMARAYQKDAWLPLLGIMGGLAKETVVVVFPFLVADLWRRRRKRSSGSIYLILTLFSYWGAIHWVRARCGVDSQFVWLPDTVFLSQNLYRIKAYASPLLAFGIPGWLALSYLIKHFRMDRDRMAIPMVVGMFSGLALFAYSFLAAYSDGRFVWTAYPFMIVLALCHIRAERRRHTASSA